MMCKIFHMLIRFAEVVRRVLREKHGDTAVADPAGAAAIEFGRGVAYKRIDPTLNQQDEIADGAQT
jgi:hypothetical protein